MEVRYAKYRFKDRWRNLINGSKFKSDTTISTFLNKVEEKRAWWRRGESGGEKEREETEEKYTYNQ